jgi:FKBP-type peptidyl-prolyl cis-trans isomerase
MSSVHGRQKLEWRDVVVGTGPPVRAGAAINLRYAVSENDTTPPLVFNLDGEPQKTFELSFTVGAGDVAEALEAGVLGMREGGRRTVAMSLLDIATSSDAYEPPTVQGGPVTYVIDLLEVHHQP